MSSYQTACFRYARFEKMLTDAPLLTRCLALTKINVNIEVGTPLEQIELSAFLSEQISLEELKVMQKAMREFLYPWYITGSLQRSSDLWCLISDEIEKLLHIARTMNTTLTTAAAALESKGEHVAARELELWRLDCRVLQWFTKELAGLFPVKDDLKI